MRKVTELKENEVIHCHTKRESIFVCELMTKAGLNWCDGQSYLSKTKYDIHKEFTCYYVYDGTYDSLEYFTKRNYKIYPASDFLKPKKIKIQDLTDKHNIIIGSTKYLTKFEKLRDKYAFTFGVSLVFKEGAVNIRQEDIKFPKCKKSKTQKRIKALEQRLNASEQHYDSKIISLQERVKVLEKETYLKETPLEQRTEAIDWDKPQIFQYKESDVIVISNGKYSENEFQGTTIKSDKWGVGHFSNLWAKEVFKPFTGTINIEK